MEMYDRLRDKTTPKQIPRLKAIREFTPEQRSNLIEGVGDFSGIRGFFNWLESKKYKVQARVMLARYRAYVTCAVCGGTRLKADALNVRLNGRTIAELAMLPVRELLRFFETLELTAQESEIASRILEGLLNR